MPYNFPLVTKVVVKLEKSNLDNVVDRAHYYFTFAMIIFFALINATELLFGSPVQCMTPAEYAKGWSLFVNEYCFVSGSYVTEGHSYVPDSSSGTNVNVTYYQWFAYVLFVQCLLFFAPHFVWTSLQGQADVDVQGVVDKCASLRTELNPVKGRDRIHATANYLKKLSWQRQRDSFGGGLGDWATICYLGSKFLNMLNVLVQFHVINLFVGNGQLSWGFQVVRNALNGIFWDQTGFFPRLSFCEFQRDDLFYTTVKEAYCVLMLNMVNEKIFVVLYFWFLILFAVTLADLVYSLGIYIANVFRLYEGKRFLKNLHLLAPHALVTGDRKNAFVTEVLGRDGLLVLRFIEAHAGTLIASQLACRIFELVNSFPEEGARVSEESSDSSDEVSKKNAGDLI